MEAVPIQEAEKLACPSVPVRDQSSGSRGEIRKDGDDGRSAGEELRQVVSNFARRQEPGAGGLGASGQRLQGQDLVD